MAAALQSSISTAFITASVPAGRKPILGCSGIFDENAPAPVKSTAMYVVKLNSPDDAVRVAKAIDEKFANFPLKPRPRPNPRSRLVSPSRFWKHRALNPHHRHVRLFTLLWSLATLCHLGRERVGELAVLKAIASPGALFFSSSWRSPSSLLSLERSRFDSGLLAHSDYRIFLTVCAPISPKRF